MKSACVQEAKKVHRPAEKQQGLLTFNKLWTGRAKITLACPQWYEDIKYKNESGQRRNQSETIKEGHKRKKCATAQKCRL